MTPNSDRTATISPRTLAGLTAGLLLAATGGVALAQPDGAADPCEGGEAAGAPMPVDETVTEAPTPDPMPVAEPAEVAASTDAAEPSSRAGYDKGFFIESESDKGSFELKINARVQDFWEFISSDDGAGGRDNESGFQIRRARLTLEGHIYSERIGYKFQTDFGKGFVTLKDFIVDLEASDKLWFRAGQWKQPFSRQQILSSSKLEFVDRAITDKAFLAARDIGIGLHNGYEKSPDLEWAVGIFNGTGDKPGFEGVADPTTGAVTGGFTNVPAKFKPNLVARVGINHGGIKGYSEADLEGGPLRWAVGAGVWLEGDFDGNDATRQQATVDAMVKVEGLSAEAGVFFALDNSKDAMGADVNGQILGLNVQVGKMFGQLEPVARYALVKQMGDFDSKSDTHEIAVGAGWFAHSHNVKFQADVGPRITEGGGVGDEIVGRAQLSVGF